MSIHVSKYDNPQYVVIDPDEQVLLFTLKRGKSDSINRFIGIWGSNSSMAKWKNCYRAGYRCVKVEVSVKPV